LQILIQNKIYANHEPKPNPGYGGQLIRKKEKNTITAIYRFLKNFLDGKQREKYTLKTTDSNFPHFSTMLQFFFVSCFESGFAFSLRIWIQVSNQCK